MKMIHDAGTSGPAEIHPHIKSLGRVNIGEGRLTSFEQVHQLIGSLLIGFIEVGHVRVGHYHQMAGPIRIDVQDDKIKPGSR